MLLDTPMASTRLCLAMNAFQSISYFQGLGLLLRQAPGRRRGAWELGPPDSHQKAKSFASLKACWDWWRHVVIYTVMEEESVSIAANMALRDPETRARITRWASSRGWQELPDDLLCTINYPFLTLELTDKLWSSLPQHPVARHAWGSYQTDEYCKILAKLSERDRDALSSATSTRSNLIPVPNRL